MLDDYFPRRPKVVARLKRSRFAADLESLIALLETRGHKKSTFRHYVLAAAHLIHCLDRGLIELEGLTAETLQRFARRHACSCRCPQPRDSGPNFRSVAIHLFKVMEERHGLARAPKTPPPETPTDRMLMELNTFLRDTKGLIPYTRERCIGVLRPLLAAKFGASPADFSALSVVEVRDWVAARAVNSAPNTVRRLTSALRTLFRFLAVNGRPGAALSAAVPTIRSTRLCHVPHGLDEQQLRQLIDAIDTSKAIGLRTAAMVQCMVILGLRAGEVAALELADIDWRAGTLRLGRTKPRRAAVLPLSPPVGRSIAAYLQRGRPKTEDRHVFVRHFMPIGLALKSVDVTCTIGRAIRHAGLILPSSGAHILRHTAAGRLVRAGAKMKEVADVLRHRELDTTRIYTKVDWPRLAEVALPWPTEVA